MDRTKMITTLAAGLLLASNVTSHAAAGLPETSSRLSEEKASDTMDTLLINGRAYLLESVDGPARS